MYELSPGWNSGGPGQQTQILVHYQIGRAAQRHAPGIDEHRTIAKVTDRAGVVTDEQHRVSGAVQVSDIDVHSAS